MYFTESSRLIEQHVLDKDSIKILDRELAHVYATSGHAYIELTLLVHRVGIPKADVERLIRLYEHEGIVSSYDRVECPCGEKYDPEEGECGYCGQPVSQAAPTGEICYRVSKQPAAPAFDPANQPVSPAVFISYRHADSSKLAADIYYSLRKEGYSVFLDDGNIPPGANAEQIFLRAASQAKYFIALVSSSYFESLYCKQEIAHAARKRQRLLRINIPPVPSAPNDMPWVDGPNWISERGSTAGLSPQLEKALLSAITIQPSMATIADLRIEACQFLMDQLSLNDLDRLWNRLQWMRDIRSGGSKSKMINQILQEANAQRLDVLCNALAP